MSSESIVYGCIKDTAFGHGDVVRRQRNRLAMSSLPKSEDWSYLSQEMFSVPRLEASKDHYQTDVIHFGASYRAIEYEWAQWMARFEKLLDEMYWVSAVVHLETEFMGIHTFTWVCYGDSHEPGSGVQDIRCEWMQENNF